MIEMEDHTSDLSEARIPFLDYKTYTDRNFFLPSKDGANDAMITRKIQIPEARKAIVAQALNQFSNLLNSKTFLINVSLKLLMELFLSFLYSCLSFSLSPTVSNFRLSVRFLQASNMSEVLAFVRENKILPLKDLLSLEDESLMILVTPWPFLEHQQNF